MDGDAMKPLIKLIKDVQRDQWICGDEAGELTIITEEFLYGAAVPWESALLRKWIVDDSQKTYYNPFVAGELEWAYTPVLERQYDAEKIELSAKENGYYLIQAGYGPITKTWIYVDSFKIVSPAPPTSDRETR